ncbi:MAG TPA: formate/nitrite transporter family protein [Kiloniellales bacterium]|nr:formate/nitrite transporter family protein [Kiloniellales bacterium]
MTQPNPAGGGFDAYKPAQIAVLIQEGGVAKARLPFLQMATLGVLAGAFIAFGAMFYTLTVTGADLGFGPGRLLGGVAFSLGLILVLVGGAELFTGNNLIVMAWAERRVTTREVLRNWIVVYLANFLGALGTVALFDLAGALELSGGAVAATAARIAEGKVGLDFQTAFFRGVLCNTLVCLAVWLSFAARDVASKILAIVFPISAFVALGFEHSVANMYLIPIGMLAQGQGIDALALFANLVPVTLGNIVGGSGLVALTYWLVYLRGSALR